MGADSKILVREALRDGVSVLVVDGVLDSTTYRTLRDRIIKAALDEPPAVIADISALRTPAPSAYAVFTSARWQVSRWPDVPLLLVCGHEAGRDAVRREGVTRYVPVYDCLDAALEALDGIGFRARRWRCAEVAVESRSGRYARELVTAWLWEWGNGDQIPAATVVATELVENVFVHTDSAVALLRVEAQGPDVIIAVSDRSAHLPTRIEAANGTSRLSGLHVVAAVAEQWGCAPSSDGKTVWAAISP